MQFRVIVVTDPQTHKPTDRTDYNTLCHSYRTVYKGDRPVEEATLGMHQG